MVDHPVFSGSGSFPVGEESHIHFSRLQQRIRLALFSSDVDPSIILVFRSRLLLGLLVRQVSKVRIVAACQCESEAIACLQSSSPGYLIYGDELLNGSPVQLVNRAKAMHPDLRLMQIVQNTESLQASKLCHSMIADSDLGLNSTSPFYMGLIAMITNTTYRSPALSSLATYSADADSLLNPFVQLTQREHELLKCFSQGLTNAEAAQQLNLSPETVKTYSGRLLSKLGVSNRQKALRRAAALGLSQLFQQR